MTCEEYAKKPIMSPIFTVEDKPKTSIKSISNDTWSMDRGEEQQKKKGGSDLNVSSDMDNRQQQ